MDAQRRFGGIVRLYGSASFERFCQSHVMVIGVGGVGSWAAEALVRSGIGKISLVDMDHVAESNINRQAHALDSTLGMAKIEAMRLRLLDINPQCDIQLFDCFAEPDQLAALLSIKPDVVIDAIDQVKVKVELAAYCQSNNLPIVICGSAGGQCDPTQIRNEDLARTTHDPLLARMRSLLRKQHNYPRDPRKKFGLDVIYSTEQVVQPTTDACDVQVGSASSSAAPQGLNCAGYGSAMTVTAAFGLAAAARSLALLRY